MQNWLMQNWPGQNSRAGAAMAPVIVLGLATGPVLPAYALEAVSRPSAADDPGTASAWGYNLLKTITYETAASLDAFAFGLWFGESATGGLAFGAANYLLAGTLYYTHEMLWNVLGPDPNTTDAASLGLVKTLTYRVVSTTRVFATGMLLTGSPAAAGTYAVANNLIDATIYYVNDLAWARFGPPVDYLGAEPVAARPAASRAAARATR